MPIPNDEYGYDLYAFLCDAAVLGTNPGQPLQQHGELGMRCVTEATVYVESGYPEGDGPAPMPPFERLVPALVDWAQRASAPGRLAYVEARYRDGVTSERAIVWERGRVLMQPTDGNEAVNSALRALGVPQPVAASAPEGANDSAQDPFDVAGLGLCSSTEAWGNHMLHYTAVLPERLATYRDILAVSNIGQLRNGPTGDPAERAKTAQQLRPFDAACAQATLSLQPFAKDLPGLAKSEGQRGLFAHLAQEFAEYQQRAEQFLARPLAPAPQAENRLKTGDFGPLSHDLDRALQCLEIAWLGLVAPEPAAIPAAQFDAYTASPDHLDVWQYEHTGEVNFMPTFRSTQLLVAGQYYRVRSFLEPDQVKALAALDPAAFGLPFAVFRSALEAVVADPNGPSLWLVPLDDAETKASEQARYYHVQNGHRALMRKLLRDLDEIRAQGYAYVGWTGYYGHS